MAPPSDPPSPPQEAASARPQLWPGRLVLPRRVRRHIEKTGLLDPGERVLIALSGGMDSTVLLHLFRFALPDLRVDVRAAHFDHAMRPSSVADAAWVRGLCAAWRVPLASARAGDPPSSETAARDLRYEFLQEAARATGATHVATAHHADDQAETVLFRAARGTGPGGLAGIPARRGAVVRPLLPFRRLELTAYARAVGLSWREDPTNVGLATARNRIRREVLPLLEEIAPGAGGALARLARLARRDEAAWISLLREASEALIVARDAAGIDLDRMGLLSYHPGARARLLRRALRELGIHPGAAATRAALELVEAGRSGTFVDVGAGARVGREFDRIRIRRGCDDEAGDDVALITEGDEGQAEVRIGRLRWRARWRIVAGEDRQAAEGEGATVDEARFDPAALYFPLRLRRWAPGDRILLEGGTKKLKKLLGERRVPVSRRGDLPVLSDAEGRVLWVAGVARSTHARARPGEPALGIRVLDGERG